MTSSKKPSARENLLHVDLKDLKSPLLAWCSAQGVTPSEAVRRLLRETLQQEAQPRIRVPAEPDTVVPGEPKRLEIRMSLSQYAAMQAAAESEGMSLPRWLQALIVVQLEKRTQFGRVEVEALSRSSQALLAVGRNINQIVRNHQVNPAEELLSLAQLTFVRKLVEGHTQEVAKLLAANSRRWH